MATDATVATTTALLPRLPLQPAPLLQLPATDPHIFQTTELDVHWFTVDCCQSPYNSCYEANMSYSATTVCLFNDDCPPKDNACTAIERLVNDDILPTKWMQFGQI